MVMLQKAVPLPVRSVRWLLAALALSMVIVAIQGGVITEALTFKGYTSPSAFVITMDGRYHFGLRPTESLGFWEWSFIRDAGFTLLFLPIVTFSAWRERKQLWFLALLASLALMHMAIPFVIGFPDIAHGMDRVTHTGIGLSALLIGWWLWRFFFQSQSTLRKKIAYAIVASMLLSTALHLPVRLIFPDMEWEQRSLIPQMPERTDVEKNMHEWVRTHSTTDDRFFFLQASQSINKTHDPEFSFFVTFTGRFLVKHSFTFDPIMGKDEAIRAIENSCSSDALGGLSVDFVIVYTDEQRAWFRELCSRASFQEVYSATGISIYRFNGLSS
jgi:hypothetical protein